MEELELEEKVSVEEQERMDQENQIKQIAKQKPEDLLENVYALVVKQLEKCDLYQ